MRVSILGTGWLGLPLGKHLKDLGYEVKGSTTSPKKILELVNFGVQPYLIQIDDRVVGERGEDFFDTDVLVVTIPPSRDLERYKVTIQTITRQIKESGIKKVLYTSSTGVYGHTVGLVDETTPVKPKGVSSEGIIMAERALMALNIDLTIVRLAGLAGGKRNPGRFLAGRINALGGNAPVNFVHQTDCIEIMTQIIAENHWNEIFNICSDIHPPKHLFYTFKAQEGNFDVPTFAPDDKKASDYKIISNAKVKAALNYEFKYPDPMAF
ncbi:MAG: NAD-dependent epimerase/dehydratase family protein [Saprospiraceae bacterium]